MQINDNNQYFTLRNGIEIPRLSIDSSFVKNVEGQLILHEAIKKGYTHIDVSQVANNLSLVSSVLTKFPREKLFITFKIWVSNFKNYIEKSIDQFQSMINTDYFDAIVLHFPHPHEFEINLRAFTILQWYYETGRCRSIGLSCFSKIEIQEINQVLGLSPHFAQFFMNTLDQNSDLRKYLIKKNIVGFGFAHKPDIPILTIYGSSMNISRKQYHAEQLIQELAASLNMLVSNLNLNFIYQNDLGVLLKFSNALNAQDLIEIFDTKLSHENLKIIKQTNIVSKKLSNNSKMFSYFGELKLLDIDFNENYNVHVAAPLTIEIQKLIDDKNNLNS